MESRNWKPNLLELRAWLWLDMGFGTVLKPSEVIAILECLGFKETRQRGSHKQFRHPDGRGTTMPCHRGRDISPILLRQIARDIGLTMEDFLKHR